MHVLKEFACSVLYNYSRMTVKLGATKRNEEPALCKVDSSSNATECERGAQDIKVERIIPHPKCEFEENNEEIYKYDIALLRLVKEPLLTSNKITTSKFIKYF